MSFRSPGLLDPSIQTKLGLFLCKRSGTSFLLLLLADQGLVFLAVGRIKVFLGTVLSENGLHVPPDLTAV